MLNTQPPGLRNNFRLNNGSCQERCHRGLGPQGRQAIVVEVPQDHLRQDERETERRSLDHYGLIPRLISSATMILTRAAGFGPRRDFLPVARSW